MLKSSNRQGYVLPIVLFLVIILTSGAVFSLHIAKQKISNTALLLNTVEAQMKAESELEVLKFYMASGMFTENRIENNALVTQEPKHPEILFLDNREHNISSNLSIHLQDTAGLLDVSSLNVAAMGALLRHFGTFTQSDTFNDSIMDWVDADDFHALNGAESSYYRDKKLSYTPRNINYIQSPQELKLIRGMNDISSDQWRAVEPFLIFSPKGGFNYLTAPPEILTAVLQLPEQEQVGMQALRKRDLYEFSKQIMASRGFDPETSTPFPSKVVKVNIVVQYNEARIHLDTLIDCNSYKDTPIHTIIRY